MIGKMLSNFLVNFRAGYAKVVKYIVKPFFLFQENLVTLIHHHGAILEIMTG